MNNVKQQRIFFMKSKKIDFEPKMKNFYTKHYTIDPSRVSDSWAEISEPISTRMVSELPTALHESLIKSLVKGNAQKRQRKFSRA